LRSHCRRSLNCIRSVPLFFRGNSIGAWSRVIRVARLRRAGTIRPVRFRALVSSQVSEGIAERPPTDQLRESRIQWRAVTLTSRCRRANTGYRWTVNAGFSPLAAAAHGFRGADPLNREYRLESGNIAVTVGRRLPPSTSSVDALWRSSSTVKCGLAGHRAITARCKRVLRRPFAPPSTGTQLRRSQVRRRRTRAAWRVRYSRFSTRLPPTGTEPVTF